MIEEMTLGGYFMKKLIAAMLCAAVLLSLCACGNIANDQPAENLPQQSETEQNPPVQNEPEEPALPTVSGERNSVTGVWPEMQTAEFWIALDDAAEQLRMTAEECRTYNDSFRNAPSTGIADLSRYGAELTTVQVMSAMPRGTHPEGNYYIGNQLIKEEQREEIRLNSNMAGLTNHEPQYGFLLRSTQLRGFPTDLPLYSTPGDTEFDQCVETRAKCWEPFVLLHVSTDGLWYLIRTGDYTAWVAAEDTALCSREEWDALRQRLEEDFLVVTAPRLSLAGSAACPELAEMTVEMGTRLPLEPEQPLVDNATTVHCWSVLLPQADENGQLTTLQVRIPMSEDAHEGYLPYTGETLLRQAFRLLGQRYGWGGMFSGWDCSSFCQDVYLTMGVRLPRNSGEQSRSPGRVDISGLSAEERTAKLLEMGPGTLVTMSGHQTMYIGNYDGEPYLLHATYGIYDTAGRMQIQNAVVVSSALAFHGNAKSLLNCSHTFVLPEN